MKKLALALSLSLMTVSAAAVSTPAYASCPKSEWLYEVDGIEMTGNQLPAYAASLGGPSGMTFAQAVQWLSQNGHIVHVVDRNYCE